MKSSIAKIELARYFEGEEEFVLKVGDYESFRKNRNKVKIAKLVYERLYGRYLKPFEFPQKKFKKKYKNGFAIMANCCLLIETLVSFKNGWGDSNRRSEDAFKQFFKSNQNFGNLKNQGQKLYKNVRCGILHQGETSGGWRIRRNGKVIFDPKIKTINAFKFAEALKKTLQKYTDELKNGEWDSEIWDNCRTKMRKIIKNCEK